MIENGTFVSTAADVVTFATADDAPFVAAASGGVAFDFGRFYCYG